MIQRNTDKLPSNRIPRQALDTSNPVRSADCITFDTDTVLLFIDSCVTGAMTPAKSDFVAATYVPVKARENFQGSGESGEILGSGTA